MNVRVSNHRRPNDEYEGTIGSEQLLKLYAIKHIEGFNPFGYFRKCFVVKNYSFCQLLDGSFGKQSRLSMPKLLTSIKIRDTFS